MDLNDSNRVPVAPPAELAGRLPRKVKLSLSDAKFLLLAMLLFPACSAWFAVSFGSEAIQQTRWQALLQGNGRDVVGQVTGILRGMWAPTVVKYSFTVDGKPYFGRAKEPNAPGPWGALQRSDTIPVRFFPPNPAINHPAAWEWSPLIYRYDFIALIFFNTLSVIAFAGLMRERKLAREGKPAAGLVTGCTPNGRSFQVEYEFCTEEGALLKGKFGCADPYQVGERVWILYLPQNPKRNHSYPLENYGVAY